MLTKLLFILSAAALAGGTGLAYKNRKAFIETRQEKISLNADEIKPLVSKIDETIELIDSLQANIKDANSSAQEKGVILANAEANLKAKNADLAKIADEIQEKQTELTTLEAQLAQLLGNETIDAIEAKITQLEQDIAALTVDQENATKEYDVAKNRISEQESTVASFRRASAERTKGISQNALEGTVIATNQGFGFAVVNIGQNRGLTSGTKLIVKRGNQRIGTLTTSSVSANKTIADIEVGSVPAGMAISPGDTVILEKVQR